MKQSLTAVTLNALASTRKSVDVSERLYKALESSDLSGLRDIFHSFFASIPHDWYRSSAVAGYEAFYASIFYCYFSALGIDTRPEDVTNHGQADMTVLFQNRIFVFEFKVIELTESGSALAQIKKKKYYEKYLYSSAGAGLEPFPAEMYLIGVEFSKEERNITNFEWEKLVSDLS